MTKFNAPVAAARRVFAVAPKKRLLIVEDHPLMRQALRIMAGNNLDPENVREAGDVATALKMVRESAPDLALVDLTLPDGSGIDLIKQIKAIAPMTHILVLSMHEDQIYAERAVRAGALGYINKQRPPEVIKEAIQRVLSGQVYLSEAVSSDLLQRLAGNPKPTDRTGIETFSDRELEVFQLIGKGYTTRAIATHLCVSVKTVDAYRQRLKGKLGIDSAPALTRRAVEWVLSKS